MTKTLILASASKIRAKLLSQANVPFEVIPAKIDEDTIKTALTAEGASPRDVVDALSEGKARKIANKFPEVLVLGCDQVLEIDRMILSKPRTKQEALEHLKMLRGKRHSLLSGAVLYDQGNPVWRHIGQARLTMRNATDRWLDDYLNRNWHSIQHSVGGYKIEEEGVRLFTRIEGDNFTIQGLPLLELLSYLTLRGSLPG